MLYIYIYIYITCDVTCYSSLNNSKMKLTLSP